MNAIEKALTKVFGSANERLLKKLWPVVARIKALEPEISRLSDEQLREKTEVFKARLAQRLEGAEELSPQARKQLEQEALDEILPEAFACVREASVRSTGMRHFDVQMIGGMILHRGMIAEMRTGEGKTLVATLPVYLNALLGRGVHVVTVTITWRGATPSGWEKSTSFSECQSALFRTTSTISSGRKPTSATSPTARTTNSASITCATI